MGIPHRAWRSVYFTSGKQRGSATFFSVPCVPVNVGIYCTDNGLCNRILCAITSLVCMRFCGLYITNVGYVLSYDDRTARYVASQLAN